MPVPPVIQMYRYVMGSGGGLGNLLKASEEFQQTVDWVRYPTSSQTPTVNADSRPDPNGGTTADQVGFTANTSARLQQTVTLSASTQYTFSVYARAVSGTVDFRMRNVTLKAAEVKTATTTGPDGGGFTRFTYTFTTTTAGSYELALQNDTNATAKDVIFWGAMLNQGGTALDYEYAAPTTGGSAPAPAYAGFGDAFGGVTAYYSLRQFTEAETLNAIRVRRSSDDTEQDIGFDSNGDLDTTALLAFVNADVNQYTSDFSSGTDGFSTNNATLLGAQSVGGESAALKVTLTGGSTFHIASKTNLFDTGATYSVRFKYYIPSGQTVNQIKVGDFDSADQYLGVTDAWTDGTISGDPDFGFFRIWAAQSGSTTVDADGDVFYLKNIVVTQTTADGAVTTFYDQSGNGNDATNATASEQPLVVSGGSVITMGGASKPAIQGSTSLLALTTALTPTDFSIIHTSEGAGFVASVGNYIRISDYYRLNIAGNSYTSNDVNAPNQSIYVSNRNGTTLNLRRNGSEMSGSPHTSVTTALNITNFFEYSSLSYPGKMSEIIIFESDQSTNLTGIESNINDHFSIYP